MRGGKWEGEAMRPCGECRECCAGYQAALDVLQVPRVSRWVSRCAGCVGPFGLSRVSRWVSRCGECVGPFGLLQVLRWVSRYGGGSMPLVRAALEDSGVGLAYVVESKCSTCKRQY